MTKEMARGLNAHVARMNRREHISKRHSFWHEGALYKYDPYPNGWVTEDRTVTWMFFRAEGIPKDVRWEVKA